MPPRSRSPEDVTQARDSWIIKDYMRESGKVARAKGALPEYVILARAETGLYQTLQKLRARVRTSSIVCKYLNPRH